MKCDFHTCSVGAEAVKFFISIEHYGNKVRCMCAVHSTFMIPFPDLQEFSTYEAATAALAMQAL